MPKQNENYSSMLNSDQVKQVISYLPARSRQAMRLVDFLSKNPRALTGKVCSQCQIVNIAHVARMANQYIYKAGYVIGCAKPLRLEVLNSFGEPSNAFEWSLYTVNGQAANDDNGGK